ncbi:unnamed protein product [Heterobilharzia americana]|nr:unnamed protein product [Heterobilharzia americana]
MDLFSCYYHILRYLERDSLLEHIRHQLIRSFCTKRRPVCSVNLQLILHELVQELGSFSLVLLRKVSKFERMLQEIVFCLAIEVDVLCDVDDINSILIKINFSDILCIPEQANSQTFVWKAMLHSGVPFLNKTGQSCQWQFKVYGIVDLTVNPMDPWKCALSTIVNSLPSYVSEYEFGIAFTFAFMFLDKITKAGTFFLLKWLLLLLLVQNEFTELKKEDASFLQTTCRPPALLLLGSLGDSLPNKILRAAGEFTKPFCEHKAGGSLLPTSFEIDSSGSKKPKVKGLKRLLNKRKLFRTRP